MLRAEIRVEDDAPDSIPCQDESIPYSIVSHVIAAQSGKSPILDGRERKRSILAALALFLMFISPG